MNAELAKALLAAQQAMPKITLDATNPHFHSRFVSLPNLLDTVRPVLNQAGLVLTQSPTATLDGAHSLRTRITHADTGEFLEDTMLLCLAKQDAQGQGSAITYARRYAILSMLGLAGEDDDDGVAAAAPRPQRTASAGATAAGSGSNPARVEARPADGRSADAVNPAAAAQAAQAATGDVPSDAGDPRNITVHFGKNKGRPLGELTQRQLEWYANSWTPNPQFESPLDRQLKLAVQMILGLAPEDVPADDDQIPF